MTVKNEILNTCTLFSQQKSPEQTRISAVVENWTQKNKISKSKLKNQNRKELRKRNNHKVWQKLKKGYQKLLHWKLLISLAFCQRAWVWLKGTVSACNTNQNGHKLQSTPCVGRQFPLEEIGFRRHCGRADPSPSWCPRSTCSTTGRPQPISTDRGTRCSVHRRRRGLLFTPTTHCTHALLSLF